MGIEVGGTLALIILVLDVLAVIKGVARSRADLLAAARAEGPPIENRESVLSGWGPAWHSA
jgi:hypothetical protein